MPRRLRCSASTAPLPRAHHRRRRRHPSAAFSLAEVLIGLIISAFLLGAGVKALLALIQGDTANQQELSRKDDMGRVLGLIQDEVRSARRVEVGTVASPLTAIDTTNCASSLALQRKTILILRGATSADDISYSLATPAAGSWRGPNLLVRCGPLYSAGSLQSGGSRSDDVVIDTLQSGGFTATATALSGSSINRSLQLSLISDISGSPVTSSLQVAMNSNTVYGLLSNLRDSSSCITSSGGCASTQLDATHWKPSAGDTINGDISKEDVIYLDGKQADYTISGSGNSSNGRCINGSSSDGYNCTVKKGAAASITINNGDVLVFTDGEIRIPPPTL